MFCGDLGDFKKGFREYALHLLCSPWEKKRQKEKARGWQTGFSLNAETFEDIEEQVVIQGVPYLPGLAANPGEEQPPGPASGLYCDDQSQSCQDHIGMCVHTWKSCIFQVSEKQQVSAHGWSPNRQESFSGCDYRFNRIISRPCLNVFIWRFNFISTKSWKVKIMTCSPRVLNVISWQKLS